MKIPSQLYVGDSSSWLDEPTATADGTEISPSAGWTLKYYINGASLLILTATTDDSQWLTAISAAQTTALGAGDLAWAAKATKNSEVITLDSGVVKLIANIQAAGTTFTGKSQAKTDLEAVQSAMRAIISGGAVQRYSVAGREVWKMAMSDLIVLESKLKAIVAREDQQKMIDQGLGNPNNLFVRFK